MEGRAGAEGEWRGSVHSCCSRDRQREGAVEREADKERPVEKESIVIDRQRSRGTETER